MTTYNIEYKGVTCTSAAWNTEPHKFVLIYKGCPYLYEQKRYIPQSGDIHHIRCVIEQFLEDVEKDNNGWISVKDRLPEKHTRVLCYHKFEPESSDVICENTYYSGGFWLSDGSKVTHWMPLPEPPKESEDTE